MNCPALYTSKTAHGYSAVEKEQCILSMKVGILHTIDNIMLGEFEYQYPTLKYNEKSIIVWGGLGALYNFQSLLDQSISSCIMKIYAVECICL